MRRVRQHCSTNIIVLVLLLFAISAISGNKNEIAITAQQPKQTTEINSKFKNNTVIIYDNKAVLGDNSINNKTANSATINKLNNIIIPKVILNTSLADAVNYLCRISKELDSDKVGVRVFAVFKLSMANNKTKPHTAYVERSFPNVHINLRSQSLKQIIRYVCLSAGVKYIIKDNMVVVTAINTNINASNRQKQH